MNNPLEHIMGVKEAGEMWELSADRVKGLCQSGDVIAKKVGNSWILDKNQPNPKGGRRMRKEEVFSITVEDEPGTPYPTKHKEVDNEQEAVELAEKWAAEYKSEFIYINYYRSSDAQKGYLNPDGYNITGEDWASKYK
ncbi:hypothetical protein IIO_06173 [Bacillus cereus VD115]|nr:hypothetical protein IIO_06247 [Bacillus cereus VD115]EJR51763.1 hypothetical protein IIO_06173 [Bacillus cereus VD115]